MRLQLTRRVGFCAWLFAFAAFAGLPTEEAIRSGGSFEFPQEDATVVYDTNNLRVSIWNNDTLLYVQSVLWNDNSSVFGATKEGRQTGDRATLSLDLDGDQKVTAKLDREYHVDPWLRMNGLFYTIKLGRCSSTPLKDDSAGTGAICYVHLQGERTIRIDSVVIPLSEIGRTIGDSIRVCFEARSAAPDFSVNSSGDTNEPNESSCYHIPLSTYHVYTLATGKALAIVDVAAALGATSPAFTRSLQVTNSNESWFNSSYIHTSPAFAEHVDLTNNTPDMIHQELAHSNFLSDLATALKFNPEDVSKIQLTFNTGYNWFTLEQNGAPPSVFDPLREATERYAKGRTGGHTREFILRSLSDLVSPTNVIDPDLQALLKERPEISPSTVQKQASNTSTNSAGETQRWVEYIMLDTDIATTYELSFRTDGRVNWCTAHNSDAKEFDSKYIPTILKVERAVESQMKRDNVHGLGSCHTYWRMKKVLLKEEGIDWHSPAELNPNTCYD